MDTKKLRQWYGSPKAGPVSQRRTDEVLIGANEATLLLAAGFIANGHDVSLLAGGTVHQLSAQAANKDVSHDDFYHAIDIERPAVSEAEIWNDRGDKLFILGFKQAALECFFRSIAVNNHYAPAWCNLSRYFMNPEVRDFATARFCAEKACNLDARCDMPLANLGGIAFAMGDTMATIEWCSRAVAMNDDNFFAHYYLTGALIRARDYSPERKNSILHHARRCRDLLASCPEAEPTVSQTIAWCEQS